MDPEDPIYKNKYFNHPYNQGEIILKGAIDYKQYYDLQVLANEEKIYWIYVNRDCIKMLANYLSNNLVENQDHKKDFIGICHGTRRGLEQLWFHEELKSIGVSSTIIGTEISPTAKYFPNTIEWDFHKIKDEWIGSTDFIYSNSFDHSYDPALCIQQWMKCLRPNGLCIIEWSYTQTPECYRTTICSDFFWASQDKLFEFFQSQNITIKDILQSDSPKQIISLNGTHNPISQDRIFYVLSKN